MLNVPFRRKNNNLQIYVSFVYRDKKNVIVDYNIETDSQNLLLSWNNILLLRTCGKLF